VAYVNKNKTYSKKTILLYNNVVIQNYLLHELEIIPKLSSPNFDLRKNNKTLIIVELAAAIKSRCRISLLVTLAKSRITGKRIWWLQLRDAFWPDL